MAEKQALGPLQTEWIRRLRSGEYRQAKKRLKAEGGYCCLGIACEVAAPLIGGEFRLPPAHRGLRLPGEEHFIIGDRHHSAALPVQVLDALKFKGCALGSTGTEGDFCTLSNANDRGKTFAEIADWVEANPEKVFSEPA